MSDLGLRPKELGKRINKSPRTLARWRAQKRGPKFKTYCGLVYYPLTAIDRWIKRGS